MYILKNCPLTFNHCICAPLRDNLSRFSFVFVNYYEISLKLVPQRNKNLRGTKQGQSKANKNPRKKSFEQTLKLNDTPEVFTSEIGSACA